MTSVKCQDIVQVDGMEHARDFVVAKYWKNYVERRDHVFLLGPKVFGRRI